MRCAVSLQRLPREASIAPDWRAGKTIRLDRDKRHVSRTLEPQGANKKAPRFPGELQILLDFCALSVCSAETG